jgi:ankyrin repeat protein
MAGIVNYQYTNNPLIRAVRNQDTDLVKKLLAEGANPNVLDNEGRTPLILATMFSKNPLYKDTGIYNQLLLAGADQNIRDNFGFDADYYGYEPVFPDFEKKKKS